MGRSGADVHRFLVRVVREAHTERFVDALVPGVLHYRPCQTGQHLGQNTHQRSVDRVGHLDVDPDQRLRHLDDVGPPQSIPTRSMDYPST